MRSCTTTIRTPLSQSVASKTDKASEARTLAFAFPNLEFCACANSCFLRLRNIVCGVFFILILMKIILLCVALLIMPCLADEPVSVASVDSVAYYDSLADYNYQRFRANESMSDVFFWTSVGLSVATPILVFAARGAADCYGPEGCRGGNAVLDVAAVTATILFLPSWIAYGGFSIAKIRRRRDFNNYNQKKDELLEQRKQTESLNVQVQVLPLLNPLDGYFGAVLALSF